MSDYSAIIAKIDNVAHIEGADRIQVAFVLGECVVVSKEAKVGDCGVFFQTGSQLSEAYCHHNNLFRDKEKNSDPTKSGFFEKNRHVRAQPFMKVKSQGYFAGLESLDYLKDLPPLFMGDRLSKVGEEILCCKYESEAQKRAGVANKLKGKKVKKTLVPFFVEHVAPYNNVVAAIDDRPRIIRLWNDLKIPNVISVQSGYNEF